MRTTLFTGFKRFLKQSFLISLLLSSSVFIFLRLIFFSYPVTIGEDILLYGRTVLTGWMLIMGGRVFFEVLVFVLAYAISSARKYTGFRKGSIASLDAELVPLSCVKAG